MNCNTTINLKGKRICFKNPLIMGILNITPDSFYDGSRYNTVDKALKRAEEMVDSGVDIIDVGGESTRPGAEPVSENEEIKRVIPVIESIKSNFDVFISVDTYKSKVAELALEKGASFVNDISALRFDSNMVNVVSRHKAGICLMHMKERPKIMQKNPKYKDVVKEVYSFLKERIDYAKKHGIKKESIVIDVGIGFGKTTLHNLLLLKNLSYFLRLQRPLLIGISRKSVIGNILSKGKEERLIGSISANIWAILNGAMILRVHDVEETKQAMKIITAIKTISERKNKWKN